MLYNLWPFLVSRNENLGYRTIVAPDFLINEKIHMLLAEVAGGELTGEGSAIYREIHGSQVGELTLVFRVVRADKRFLGDGEEGVLRDYHGRPIDFIEGIVLQIHVPNLVITDNVLLKAHAQVEKPYQEFWKDTTSLFTVQPSQALLLDSEEEMEGKALALVEETPFNASPKLKLPSNWKPREIFHGKHPIKAFGFSPSYKHFIVRDRYNKVDIYTLDIENDYSISYDDDFYNVSTFAFHPGKESIIFGITESRYNRELPYLIKRDAPTWEPPLEFQPDENLETATALVFDSSGQFIVTGSQDKWGSRSSKLLLWRVESREILHEWSVDIPEVHSIIFHPSEKLIAVGGDASLIKLYKLFLSEDRYEHRRVEFPVSEYTSSQHKGTIQALKFSPNGKILASSGTDKIIKLWDVSNKTLISTLKGHDSVVKSIDFSSDGKLLASGSEDGTIKIWNLDQKQEVFTRSEHAKSVYFVAFLPSRLNLISASKDRTVKIWQTES